MDDKIREKSDTLHESILEAGNAVHPKYPTDYYLDPQNRLIQWYTSTGPAIPARVYHGIWVRIFQAPANAIPESVVENLLKLEDRMEYDCAQNFQGTEWDGRDHVGIWKDKPDYPFEFRFEFATFWEPENWFGPVLQDLKEKWASGMDATQIIDSEYLGDAVNGMVNRDQAIQWLEKKIQEWQEEAD